MPLEAFQLPADRRTMAIEPSRDRGVAQTDHLLMEDAVAFLFGKMRVGHRWPGLSMVVSW